MSDTVRAKDILKTKDILTYPKNNTLGQVLANLSSSHDAAFIMDGDKFLGVINPYYTQFKSNYPPKTKVANCLFHPPKLEPDTPLSDIARFMLESRIYFLPVVDNDKLLGIATIRRLMKAISKDKSLAKKLGDLVRPKKLTTITKDTPLNKARSLLTKSKISRLPVVNDQGRLIGLITRYDLREAFISPQTSQSFLSRSGEKVQKSDEPINKYMIRNVFTISPSKNGHNIVSTMLDQNIGSVILVNHKYQPTGIVTYRDVLALVRDFTPVGPTFSFKTPKNFKTTSRFENDIRTRLSSLIDKSEPILIESAVKTGNVTGQINTDWYQIDIRYSTRDKRKSAFASIRNQDYKKALTEAVDKIKAQITN